MRDTKTKVINGAIVMYMFTQCSKALSANEQVEMHEQKAGSRSGKLRYTRFVHSQLQYRLHSVVQGDDGSTR